MVKHRTVLISAAVTGKAGRWQSRYQYKSFEPTLLNHDWQWEDATINISVPLFFLPARLIERQGHPIKDFLVIIAF